MTIKLAYSVKEAAEATGLSTRQLDRAIAAGDLVAKLSSPKKTKDSARGGKRLILASELERYLAELVDA